MAVNFTANDHDRQVIDRIVVRALPQPARQDVRLALAMDITAAHANGNPLDLDGLIEADDFNFIHDVSGIQRYIDRETGALTNCFLPRFSIRAAATGEAVHGS